MYCSNAKCSEELLSSHQNLIAKEPESYLDVKYNSNYKKAYSHPSRRNLQFEVEIKLSYRKPTR
jgi:hypothetical protein